MASKGRTLTVYLAADTKKAQQQVDGFGSKLKKMGAVAGVAAAAGIAVATKAAIDFASAGIEMAREAEKANARMDQIAKSMGFTDGAYKNATKRAREYAAALESQTAVSDEVIKGVQATLLTFAEVGRTVNEAGGAFDRATAAALDLAAAGFGTAETNAIQLGKALNDPVKGLTALTRSGVTFTEAEQDLIKAMVEAGDAASAQAMILEAIEKQVGGTAAATATASDKMQTAWANFQEKVGTALLPAMDAIQGAVTEKVIPALEKLWDEHGPAVIATLENLADWIATDGVKWLEWMADFISNDVVPAFKLWMEFIETQTLASLTRLFDAIGRIADAFGTSDESGDGANSGLARFVSWIIWLDQHLNPVYVLLDRFAGVAELIADNIDGIKDAANRALEPIRNLINGLKDAWEWLQRVNPFSGSSAPAAAGRAAASTVSLATRSARTATTRANAYTTRQTPTGQNVTINVETGVGDPVAIAEAIQRTLRLGAIRTGVAV